MPKSNRQVAFLFNEAGNLTAEMIGGKAMSLVTMAGMGMPVPPGFAVPTGVCRAYLEHARYPGRLEWHIKRCLGILEKQTGKRFGDPSNPLLVAVRSGAPVSMPGMMDTILNLGVTQESLTVLEKLGGRKFAEDTYSRFQSSFDKVVGSKVNDPREQLSLAFEAICQSWLNERAVRYRRAHNIPEDMGTAMIVQAMVFGNLDNRSGTGVLFSRNVATGDKELYGEFLPEAQGEDVVGGSVTPLPISFFAESYPEAFKELSDKLRILERQEKDVVEIEFTVESGKLWTLQYRKAKRTPVAAARFAVQSVWENRINKAEAVASLSDSEADKVRCLDFDPQALAKMKASACLLGCGLPASPGAAVGIAVFSSKQAEELAKKGQTVVLIRPETNPDDFAGMLVASAIVTEQGGVTSHAAVVARSLGKPAVVGLEKSLDLKEGDLVSVDGTSGLVISGQIPFAIGGRHKETSIFLKWYDKSRPKGQWNVLAIDRDYSANTMLNNFYIL
ncbi:MAG: pyruvate, phosphate dikinase, partial [Candidatus Yanofskybacteria bacterium]|nr:pyruvate, phosphate dikinase [Candidatus Yanofskybacteria bacterium]